MTPVQQRRKMDADRIVENSFAMRAHRLAHGPALAVYDNTPAEIAAEVHAHNEAKQKICKQCHDGLATVREAVEMQGDNIADNLDSVVEATKVKKMPLIKSVVGWYADAHALAQRHADKLAPLNGQFNSEAEKVVAGVKADLEGIGSGVETMSGYSQQDPETAKRQFDFVARNNLRARAAIQKAQQAKTEHDAAVEKVKQINAHLDNARKLLQTIADEAIASVV